MVRPQQPRRRRREPPGPDTDVHEREFDLPASRDGVRPGRVRARGAIDVRYRCEWLSTRIEGDGFVIGTSDGTPLQGVRLRAGDDGSRGGRRSRPRGCAALCGHACCRTATREERVHRRQAQLRLRDRPGSAAGRRLVLASPVRSTPPCSFLAASSPLSPAFDEHVRGGSGSHVIDAAIERVERCNGGYRIREWHELAWRARARGGRGHRRNRLPCPAAGPAEPRCRDRQRRPSSGTDAVLGRVSPCPGSTSPETPKPRRASASMARHRARAQHGFRQRRLVASASRRRTSDDEPRACASTATRSFRSSPTSSRGAELWSQKSYLARVVGFDASHGIRDEGIVPLARFVDHDHGDACAVAVEYTTRQDDRPAPTCGAAVDWSSTSSCRIRCTPSTRTSTSAS